MTNPDHLKAQNLVFRSHPKVNGELREADMMRLVFQKDHSGCFVENKLGEDQKLGEGAGRLSPKSGQR